jgi:predicted dehydrogenase
VEGYFRCPGVEIAAVASRTATSADAFAEAWDIPFSTTDWQSMVARQDVDVVSVCVPTNMHHKVTVAAAQAGKHVICEKPMAVSLEEADAMIRAAEDNGVRLFYAENWLFAPAMQRVARIVKDGAIGDVLYFRGRESHSGTHSKYSLKKAYAGGGTLVHMGIHPIGFGLSLKEGVAVSSVFAVASGGGEANLMHPEADGEDFAIAILSFEDGTWGLIEADYITRGGLDDMVEVYGTDGTIKANFSQGSPIKVFSIGGYEYAVEKAETTQGWSFPAPDERRSQGWVEEIEHFVDCIRKDCRPKHGADGGGGRRALEVALAGYEAVRLGRPVALPLSRA